MSGVRIDVRSDIDRVVAEFRAQSSQVETATYRALNRTLDKAATQSSREIRKVYNLRDRDVKKAFVKMRAGPGRLYAVLRIEGRRIALLDFDARWRPGQKGGATVRVLVAGGRKVVPGAFIAVGRGGNRQVFRRAGRERLPIIGLRSVSIPQAFSNKTVVGAVQTLSQAEFVKNFEQQITFLGGRDGG